MERASPAQLRKALEIADTYKKTGLGFVPMPVANSAEFEALAAQSLARLAELIELAERSPVGAKESK
ncbi:DUF1382 family protein [Massilia sp. CFBP 13647]|nr:DUF1382 family protein [Massilia sp. CFBP 13647]MBD8673694.1 DUF1382 family protein [Massilia sp. CFBP 13721]